MEDDNMFLFWFAVAIVIGVSEEIKLSYDAYKYHQNGGFYAKYPCLKPKDYNNNNR